MGYRRALARFAATASERDPKERFIPLFESLNWAVVLMDFWRKRGSEIDDDTLHALRFARNRVHHQWADALEARDLPNATITQSVSGRSRIVRPPTRLEWHWKPLNQLPTTSRGFDDVRGREAYEAHLAGTSAHRALGHLDDLLRMIHDA